VSVRKLTASGWIASTVAASRRQRAARQHVEQSTLQAVRNLRGDETIASSVKRFRASIGSSTSRAPKRTH
jgi:hypothetical protein